MPSLAYIAHFLKAQFTTVPLPAPGHFAGQTIIVTGAGSGLGLEAVRHLTRLGAARIIVACRSVAKGEVAIADVEKSLAASAVPDGSSCTFEAWDVDLGSFASVAAFCERAGHDLDRVDAVVESAGVVMEERVEHEGHESTLTVNVLSTMLMALLMLPLLRRTAAKHNTRPRLVIVSSDAHFAAIFPERNEPDILAALDKAPVDRDRYNVSKLFEIFAVREMAGVLDAHHVPVTVNTVHPGFCRTGLFRRLPLALGVAVRIGLLLIGRTTEMGARTLVSAAGAGPETHGQYLDTAAVAPVSDLVASAEGTVLQKRVWDAVLGILEAAQPGVTKNLE